MLPDGGHRSGGARVDLENKGLDLQSQLSNLKDYPEHVHGLEGLPGPQTHLFLDPVVLGMGCPCDMLVGYQPGVLLSHPVCSVD